MEFFNQAIDILKILVMALGAGLAVWGGTGTNQCGAILGYQLQAVAATQSCRFGTTQNTDAKEATA